MDFPDILFASPYNKSGDKKVCFVCGNNEAHVYLRNMSRVIVPMCKSCDSEWNFHGYYVLRRITPKTLIWNIFKYKLTHFKPSWFQVFKDLVAYASWGKTMKKFAKHI